MGTNTARRSRILTRNLGSPAAADVDVVMAALQDDGAEAVVTTGLTNPDVPRVITATAGGTAGDIKAIQVTVEGTNEWGETITETLPAFTVDTPGTVVGTKAFATVTEVTIPAHDGTGATTSIGVGDILGIGKELSRDTIVAAFLGGVRESTRPTVAVHASNLEANTIDLNSALDGGEVLVDYYLP